MVYLRVAVACLAAAVLSAPAPSPTLHCAESHLSDECLRPLNAAESAALEAATQKLLRHSRERCRALGAYITAHATDARIVPYPLRTPRGQATGDAHVVEHPRGTGRVHVADSIRPTSYASARPVSAKVRTIVHDFAHLALTLPQESWYFGDDEAGTVAEGCLGDARSRSARR